MHPGRRPPGDPQLAERPPRCSDMYPVTGVFAVGQRTVMTTAVRDVVLVSAERGNRRARCVWNGETTENERFMGFHTFFSA